MPTTFLTVDLGNRRCKLRTWRTAGRAAPEVLARADLASASALAEEVARWLDGIDPVDGAAVSSVADAALERSLLDLLGGRLGARLWARPDPGLAIECREPGAVGRDRLFAARGAFERVRGSAVVVDAGTALTVDAVAGDAGPPRFLGGAIAPGPDLAADALAGGTARLPRVAPVPLPRAVGRTTEEAIQAGVGLGFLGAARELVLRVARESGLTGAPVVVTGGARRFLDVEGALGPRTIVVEDLVHLGLLASAADAAR